MGIDQGSKRCAPHQGPRTVQSQIEFGRTNFRFAECSMSIGLQALLGGENPSNAGRVFFVRHWRIFAAAPRHITKSQRAMAVALAKHAALAYVADNQAR
jgi:hypothetical protein